MNCSASLDAAKSTYKEMRGRIIRFVTGSKFKTRKTSKKRSFLSLRRTHQRFQVEKEILNFSEKSCDLSKENPTILRKYQVSKNRCIGDSPHTGKLSVRWERE